VGLALRSYSESVLVPYYLVGALAIGLVAAGRCSRWRFGTAVFLAIAITILGQLRFGWFPWWIIQVGGLTGFLIVAAQPQSVAPATEKVERRRVRPTTSPRNKSASPTVKKGNAPTATKRSGQR
jgi:chromate transport protein ChrA